MSSKSSKHHKSPRSFWHPTQKPDESKGIVFSGKLKQWVVFHNFKKKGTTNITEYFLTKEEANKRFLEIKN